MTNDELILCAKYIVPRVIAKLKQQAEEAQLDSDNAVDRDTCFAEHGRKFGFEQSIKIIEEENEVFKRLLNTFKTEPQSHPEWDGDYPPINMFDITDEARELAVRWSGCEDLGWIENKVKLASDIMNYARRVSEGKVNEKEGD